jgi:hypothetical protein
VKEHWSTGSYFFSHVGSVPPEKDLHLELDPADTLTLNF